jgi:hypothetical protein
MKEIKFNDNLTELVYRWLTEEEKTRNQLRVLATDAARDTKVLAREIEALVTDFENPLSGHNSLHANLLQATFDQVDWREIARTFLEEER